MKLRILFFALLSAALSIQVLSAAANPIIIPAPPQLAAKSYLLMDGATGEIIIEHNIDYPMAPASLTKLMTSYIVAEEIARGKLQKSDMVLISDDAWRRGGTVSGSSTMFLEPRTRVSVEDLMRGVIIQSGNDASIALAEHLAGSESAFADVMNQYAQLLGMTNTNFLNATGWPVEGHYSTARDMAILARAVIYNHPEHYAKYSERNFTYNGITQPNRNRLLFRDSTVDGLKTGHTQAAGYCLVTSAERQGMRLISVVMGSRSDSTRVAESQQLLAYGFRYFETHPLYQRHQELNRTRVWKGKADEVAMGPDDAVTLTIPRGGKSALNAEVIMSGVLEAPIEVGQVLGELLVSMDGKELYRTDLVALNEVERAGFFSRLWDSLVLFISGLFG